MRKLGLVAIGLMLAAFMSTAVSPARVSAGEETPSCQGYTATIYNDNDGTINGTSKRDVIVGSDGDDVIKGNGGDDVICGEGGNDTINGNSGNDWAEGGIGSDYVAGDAGNDTLRGFINPGLNFDVSDEGITPGADDTVLGGSGKDLLIDFWGWNLLDGGSGDDWVFGQGDLFGNANNDIVSSNFGYFWWLVYESGDDDDDARSTGVCDLGDDDCGETGSNLDGGSGRDLCEEPGISCEITPN
jgi:Ca2+-binding RTX toxin-like protein